MHLGPWLALLILALAGCASSDPGPEPTPTTPVFDCDDHSYPLPVINITIHTARGEIGAVLYAEQSPLTVCNFLQYAKADYYDGTIWHRICSHVIQAGGQDTMGRAKPARDPIANEAPTSQLRNHQKTIGMARNADPDSAQAHFYVNLKDNLYLDYDGPYAPGYAVFGNITRGWDVVLQIAQTPTQPTPPNPSNPLAPPGCDGRPVPSQETIIHDIRVPEPNP